VRTEKHVSAMQNWFVLLLPRKPTPKDALQFERAMSGRRIHLLAARVVEAQGSNAAATTFAVAPDFSSLNRPFPRNLLPLLKRGVVTANQPSIGDLSEPRMLPPQSGTPLDLRHAAHRFVFKYALPYALLLRPEERTAFDNAHTLRCAVWLSGMADDTNEESIRTLLSAFGLEPSTVCVPQCGGYSELVFESVEAAAGCIRTLNGREWCGKELSAMHWSEAQTKLGVHARVKAALRRLSDGAVSDVVCSVDGSSGAVDGASLEVTDAQAECVDKTCSTKRRARSFHNFCSDKSRLRGSSCDAHHLHIVLDHCGSLIHEDLRNAWRYESELQPNTDATSSSWADWSQGDWLVIAFAAREFAPQQVRRMAGVVAAVVSGAIGPGYIDRCFVEKEVPTPLGPAESMWLDRIQLSPRAQQAWVVAPGLKVDILQCQVARLDVERGIYAAAAALQRFATELIGFFDTPLPA